MDARFYVYMWRNLANSKCYIGKGTGIRATDHVRRMHNKGKRSQNLLCRALRKHGLDKFELVMLEEGLTETEAFTRESYYITARGTKSPGGYNLSYGGEGNSGYKFTDSQRARVSTASKNMSAESRAKAAAANLGRVHSKETNEKRAAKHRGMKRSPEACANIKAAFAAALTPEVRAKMAASQKKRFAEAPVSAETRALLSAACKGKNTGPSEAKRLGAIKREAKKKEIRDALRSQPSTEESVREAQASVQHG